MEFHEHTDYGTKYVSKHCTVIQEIRRCVVFAELTEVKLTQLHQLYIHTPLPEKG